MKKIIAVVVLIFIGLVVWAIADPYAQIPGISPVVCSAKGESWIDEPNVWIGVDRPGCYNLAASPSPQPTATTNPNMIQTTEGLIPSDSFLPHYLDPTPDDGWTRDDCEPQGGHLVEVVGPGSRANPYCVYGAAD